MLKIENAAGIVLAYLNNLTEAKVHEVLNGEYTLSFVAIIDHLKTDYLYDDNNLINYENDLFRVVELTELHDENDGITVAVECEHISYDLINNVMSNFNYTYANAASVMTQCLLGTDFNLRSCDITEKTDIQYTEECNSKQISIAIANNWHGELRYYRHYIDLLQSRGVNRGTGFIFGKNLKSVKRIINRAEGTTSYEVDIMEGSETEELGHYELGDTVRIMDSRLNVDYSCKIIEIEKDILTGLNSKVVLGDAIKDMRSSFNSVRKDVQEVKQRVDDSATEWDKAAELIDNSGNLVLGKLNALTQIATKIINSTGTFVQSDNYSMWHDQPIEADSTFATKWSAQGLVFANSKKLDGTWNWQTAISASGVMATELTASCLNTVTANILSLVVENLIGKTITGITINGSKFISSNNTGSSMTLDSGRIDFKNSGGGTSILNSAELGLWNNNRTVLLEAYNSFSLGAGSILSSSGTMIVGSRSYSNRITFSDDGTIRLNAGLGNGTIVEDNLEVWGDKQAVVPTQHYGVRSLYAEEADKSYFSTKGIVTIDDMEITINIDPIFLEVIELNSTCPYMIQLTPYSNARVWVEDIKDDKFTIKSDRPTTLTYDLKAIRISYQDVYLEEKKYHSKKDLEKIQRAAISRMEG